MVSYANVRYVGTAAIMKSTRKSSVVFAIIATVCCWRLFKRIYSYYISLIIEEASVLTAYVKFIKIGTPEMAFIEEYRRRIALYLYNDEWAIESCFAYSNMNVLYHYHAIF